MSGLGYEVADIVEGIWRSEFDLLVTSEDPACLSGQRTRTWAGIVHISGAWEGSVAIQCPEPLLSRLAAPSLGLDRQRQALGDLARMIAEPLSTVLPGPCALSITETVELPDFRLQLPHAAQVLQSAFRAADQVFAVTIFQRFQTPAPR